MMGKAGRQEGRKEGTFGGVNLINLCLQEWGKGLHSIAVMTVPYGGNGDEGGGCEAPDVKGRI
jgi:hypothetical protein